MRSLIQTRFPTAASWLAVSSLLTACSLAPPPGRAITISLPQGSGTATAARNQGTHLRNGPTEASFSDFNCYAINVTAADIPSMSGVSCVGTPVGIVAGFTSVSSGSITVSVPDGAARNFQLIGVATAGACPDLPTILNLLATNNPTLQQQTAGVGQPYVLGSTTSDISADTAITINASFNASTSQQLFSNCSNGSSSSYPPTKVLGAASDVQGPYDGGPGSYAFPFTGHPAAALDGSELSSVSVPASVLSGNAGQSLISQGTQDTQPVFSGEGVAEVTPGAGKRAVAQLRWDATGWDLTSTPYVGLQLAIAGGLSAADFAAASCQTAAQSAVISAAVWNQTRGYWMPLTQGNEYNNSSTAGTGIMSWFQDDQNYTPVQASELLITGTDGHKYIVVNAESNYFASGSCSSAIYVAKAQALLYAKAYGGGDDNDSSNDSGLWLQPVGLAMQSTCDGSVCSYNTVSGTSDLSILVNGGTPPYQFQQTTGGGSIDPVTGHMITGAEGEIETIQVTDSVNRTTSLVFNVIDPTILASVGVQNIEVNGAAPSVPLTVHAGDCISVELEPLGFGYRPITLSSSTPIQGNLPARGPSAGMSGFTASAAALSSCSTSGTTMPMLSPGELWQSFVLTGATTTGEISFNTESGTGPWVNIPVVVTPAAAYKTYISNVSYPSGLAINEGYCTPLRATIQDSYGNDVASATEAWTQIAEFYTSSAHLYSDSACTNTSFSGLPVANSALFYIKPLAGSGTTSGTSTVMNLSGSFTYPSLSAQWYFTIFSPGAPTRLLLSSSETLSSALDGQCVPFTLTPVDSMGVTATTALSTGSYAYFYSLSGGVYTTATCTSAAQTSLLMNLTGPTNFWVTIPANTQSPWSFAGYITSPYLLSNYLGF